MRLMIPCCAALLTLAACDGATPGADGPLRLGIVSGNNQVATAGAQQLGEPVVGKLVRTPGGIAFNLVTPAYAQGTVVNGSPVAGAVVCAVAVTEGGLVPFTPCTNTEKDGTAVFFFSPGTRAGEARSEIRGTVEGQPAVFDTVVALVEPGPPGSLGVSVGISGGPYGSGTLPYHFPDGLVQDAHGNLVDYSLQADPPLGVDSADTRRLVVLDSAAWARGAQRPTLKVEVRVVAGGQVVATGLAENRGGNTFEMEWRTAAFPFRRWSH